MELQFWLHGGKCPSTKTRSLWRCEALEEEVSHLKQEETLQNWLESNEIWEMSMGQLTQKKEQAIWKWLTPYPDHPGFSGGIIVDPKHSSKVAFPSTPWVQGGADLPMLQMYVLYKLVLYVDVNIWYTKLPCCSLSQHRPSPQLNHPILFGDDRNTHVHMCEK